MWRGSPLKKVRTCRRYPHDKDSNTVSLRGCRSKDGGLSVGFGGLRICGSWHSCLTCGAKIAIYRAAILAHIFLIWQAMGNTVVLATFSARHNRKQRLSELVLGLRSGWKAVKSGRPWREDKANLGIAWDVRAFEGTHGDEHGWHPHYHAFFLVEGQVSQEMAEAVCWPMWQRWRAGLAEVGMTAVARVRRNGVDESAGFDVKVMNNNDYTAQDMGRYPFTMALEAVGGVFKRGRQIDAKGNLKGKRHRTPFEVMEHYAVALAEGDQAGAEEDQRIIMEWSQTATDMRFRQCPITKRMREFFTEKARELNIPGPLLDAEQLDDDQDIAEAEAAGTETLAHVPATDYTTTIVYEMHTLKAAARSGFASVVAWFDQRRIPIELTAAGEALLAESSWMPDAARTNARKPHLCTTVLT